MATLGPFEIAPLAVGAWAWGDRAYWGYEERFGPSDVVDAFVAAVEGGVDLFDTAEVYGHGRSEQILGWMARRAERVVRVATKFGLLPGRSTRDVPRALDDSLRRLRRDAVDLYLVHWPDRAAASIASLMDAMAAEVARGRVRAIGVSNFSSAEVREAHDALARHGLPLACNQVRYGVLHRAPETDGVLDTCRELGVTVLAYSPLDQGIVAGRYDVERRPVGPRADLPEFQRDALERAARVRATLAEIGRAHGDRTTAQVALRWLIDRGVVPVVGATSGAQMAENVGALRFALEASAREEIDRL